MILEAFTRIFVEPGTLEATVAFYKALGDYALDKH